MPNYSLPNSWDFASRGIQYQNPQSLNQVNPELASQIQTYNQVNATQVPQSQQGIDPLGFSNVTNPRQQYVQQRNISPLAQRVVREANPELYQQYNQSVGVTPQPYTSLKGTSMVMGARPDPIRPIDLSDLLNSPSFRNLPQAQQIALGQQMGIHVPDLIGHRKAIEEENWNAKMNAMKYGAGAPLDASKDFFKQIQSGEGDIRIENSVPVYYTAEKAIDPASGSLRPTGKMVRGQPSQQAAFAYAHQNDNRTLDNLIRAAYINNSANTTSIPVSAGEPQVDNGRTQADTRVSPFGPKYGYQSSQPSFGEVRPKTYEDYLRETQAKRMYEGPWDALKSSYERVGGLGAAISGTTDATLYPKPIQEDLGAKSWYLRQRYKEKGWSDKKIKEAFMKAGIPMWTVPKQNYYQNPENVMLTTTL